MAENKEFEEKIKNCSEAELYFIVDEFGGFIWRMNHELSHDRIPEANIAAVQEDINNVRDLQKQAVTQTIRFGVPEFDVLKPSEEYWKWYRFWDDWKKNLSNSQWNEVEYKLNNEQPLDGFLPEKKWNE